MIYTKLRAPELKKKKGKMKVAVRFWLDPFFPSFGSYFAQVQLAVIRLIIGLCFLGSTEKDS